MQDLDYTNLTTLLEEKNFRALKKSINLWNEVDIASFLDQLPFEQAMIVFRLLEKNLSADVFACLDIELQENIINRLADHELSRVMEELYTDDMVDMLEELPATMVKRILRHTTPETRTLVNQYLNYPENSAGSIMTSEYIALKKNMTVADAFAYIRENGTDSESIYTCYVTTATRELEGVVSLRSMIMNPYETVLEDIMDKRVIFGHTHDDQEEISSIFHKYDFMSLPIVDAENRLVGIITYDDAFDVLEQEATEDIEKMAAMLPSEKPYLKTGVLATTRNRIPWLLFLMISSMAAGAVLNHYEAALAAVPLLMSFTPMLTDTGGNAGSQTSTSIIRSMTLGEIAPRDIFQILWKEFRVAVLCGAILALVNFLRLMIQYPGRPLICLTVVLSLFFTVVLAKALGCILPIGAKLLKLDPAIMAAPLITTLVDTCSLIIYFRFACMLLDSI